MSDERRGARLLWAAAVALGVFHVVLLTRVYPLGTALSADPLVSTDYALHSTRAMTAGTHYLPHGRLFGLDPFHAGGQIASTVHFLDNKLAELAVGVLGPLLGAGRAFNVFVFLAFATLPLGPLLAARLLRASWPSAIATGWLASLAFHGDAYTANWTLFGGYGFLLCSAYAPLAAAALGRHVEDGTRRSGLVLLATAPLFYAHGLMPPLTALLGLGFLPSALRAGPRRLVVTVASVIGIVLLNLPWLAPLFADWHTLDAAHVTHVEAHTGGLPVGRIAGAALGGKVYGLLLPGVLGIAGLVVLWRRGRRAVTIALALGTLVVLHLGYGGATSHFIASMVEPKRLRVTAPLLLAIPAGVALTHWGARLAGRFGLVRVVVVAGVLFALPFPWTGMPIATRMFGTARIRNRLPDEAHALQAALETLGDPAGRIAFEELGPKPSFGSYVAAVLPSRLGRPWTGGPYYREITARRSAQLANGRIGLTPIEELSDAELLRWMDVYDVTGLAVTSPEVIVRLRGLGDAVREVGEVGSYALFETARAANPMLVGAGSVRYDFDVANVTPEGTGDVVVKLHWDHRLSVEGAEVLREEVAGVPMGFVRVRGHGGEPFEIRVSGLW